MKKRFYFAMVALAMSLSASAVEMPQQPMMTATPATAQPKAKAKTMAEFVGEYDWTYVGKLNSDQGGTLRVTIEQVPGTTNEVTIKGLVKMAYKLTDETIKATINFNDGTIFIPDQTICYYEAFQSNLECVHKYNDNDPSNWKSVGRDVKGELTSDGFFIEDELLTFCIPAFGVSGYNYVASKIAAVKVSGGEEPGGGTEEPDDNDPANGADRVITGDWKSCGNAELIDGWFLAGYYGDFAKQLPTTTQVEQSVDNPNLIRLVNPYQNVYASQVNQDTGEGYVLLDITDPNLVIVEPNIYSGLWTKSYGKFYMYNWAGYYRYYEELTNEEVKETLAANGVTPATITNGQYITIPDAIYGLSGTKNGCFQWLTYEGDVADMTVYITLQKPLSGVEDVEMSNESAPVYYNLQGVQVANPQSGVFIKVSGNKAEKVMMK